MDANGLRFWMLADRDDWDVVDADWDAAHRCLKLRSLRDRPLPPIPDETVAETDARIGLATIAQTRDAFGTRAYWSDADSAIVATGAVPGIVRLLALPAEPPTDLAVGYDGVLYVVTGGRILMHDLRGRWSDRSVELAGFVASRVAPDPAGGAWVLDTTNQQLGHVHGIPLPDRPWAPWTACTVRPCEENPNPPVLEALPGVKWAGREAVAIACAADGRLAVLTWRPGADAELLLQRRNDGLDVTIVLRGVRFPYTLAWLDTRTIAVRIAELPDEALVFDVDDVLTDVDAVPADGDVPQPVPLDPVGDVFALRDSPRSPFVHGLDATPHYITRNRSPQSGEPPDRTAPLRRLSAPAFASTGVARGSRPLDGGAEGTVWHRLYVEALVPPGCGMVVMLAATNEPAPPPPGVDWHAHVIGEVTPGPGAVEPRAAWVPFPSEVPFAQGLLHCPPKKDRAGLFTALVQRSNRRVRSLRGRYLWVELSLRGLGNASPAVAAVRAYASRFSYVDRYLPELYREKLFGRERDEVVVPPADGSRPTTTREDFLARFVANFEGVLTTLEDRVADAWLVTDPRTVPEPSIDWLANWIGLTIEPSTPAALKRRMIREAPRLYRERGTLAGLRRALDIATDDGCSRGRIVIVEEFRLRRTFATILGADLANEQDPLLGGIAQSGNSIVGDTLFLGDERRNEFLALFNADPDALPAEEEAIARFFDRFANRVTILVHQDVGQQDLARVRRIVDLEKPAHIESRVVPARQSFMVGVASLVGVDTSLSEPQPPRPVHLDRSALGGGDVLIGPASLDPRLRSSATVVDVHAAIPPTAVLNAPAIVDVGESFDVDGSGSSAAPQHSLSAFVWTLMR